MTEPARPPPDEYETFRDLAKKLIAVPKKEVDQQLASDYELFDIARMSDEAALEWLVGAYDKHAAQSATLMMSTHRCFMRTPRGGQ